MLSAGSVTAVCAYDYANRRIRKAAGGADTHYIWEGLQVIAEYNASTGALLVEHVNTARGVLARIEAGVTRYVLADRLSTRAITDTGGVVVGRRGHLPFGEEIGVVGEADGRKFTSYERDGETGIDYAINRGYSPHIGRFLQADPHRSRSYVANPRDWNRYVYVRNDSVNKVDPLGLDGEDSPGDPPRVDYGSVTITPQEDPFDDPFFKVGSLLDSDGFVDPRRIPVGRNTSTNLADQADYQARTEEMYKKGWAMLYKASRRIDPNDPEYRKECADLLKGKFDTAADLLKFFQDLAAGKGGGINFTSVFSHAKIGDTIISSDGTVKIMFWGDFSFPRPGVVDSYRQKVGGKRRDFGLEEFQLTVILHELGYASEAHAASHTSAAESDAYTKQVYEKCIK